MLVSILEQKKTDYAMVKESSAMQMEESMTGTGNTGQWMDTENSTIQMRNLLMKENGKIMPFVARELFIMKNLFLLITPLIIQTLIIYKNTG